MIHQTYTVVHARNPFDPARDRTISTRQRRVRLASLAPKTALPFVCLVNGQPVLRAEWDKRPQHGDIVTFVTLPQGGGGGGSNPLNAVLSIALMVYGGPMAGALNSGLGLGVTSEFGMGMLKMGVMMAGGALINALVPPPRPPSPHQAAAMAAPSPTYSLNAQGNSARLGGAIPVQYGRHIAFPDFAAEPYAEYVGNEQYLYQMFVLGQGEYSIEAIRIEDTPIASFEDITHEMIAPGGTVKLFPTNVVSSVEVAGQEALTSTALGPFIVNASGTLANYLGIDVVCPKGLYYANDSGGLNEKSVTFTVEAQTVDGSGTPYGSWATLGTETITAATNTPQRRSFKYAVTEARYQVRLTRTDTKDTGARAGHDLNWAGLRAYLPGVQQYGNLTVIAMRMKASNSLSQAASRRVNVICTRKLPSWNPTTGWGAPAATSAIAWALADVLRADYGGKLADAYIDLAQLYALDQIWQARGDTFNGRFDNTMTVWEAVTQIARCGRAKAYQQGGIVHVARDQAQSVPVAMFGPRNIVRGSLKVDYLMPTEETADAVTVQYFDSATWKPAEVTAQLAGSSAANPAKVQLFGCTGRDQAWREGMYIAACNRYRRRPITHSTEMEGFIPTFGDLVALAHVRLTHAQGGEVVAWDAGTLTLTLDEPLTFGAGTHYIGLRKRDGGMDGPYVATAGGTPYQAVLAELPSITPYTGGNEERTHFTFGSGSEYRELALLTSVKPRGLHQVELAYINDDPLVHSADLGTTPSAPAAWQLAKVPAVPAVSGLQVVQGGTPAKPLLAASWQPAPGADRYIVEQSADGVAWTGAGTTTATSLSVEVQPGAIHIRVAGVGLTRGAWVYWSGTAGAAIAPPSEVTGLALAEAFTGPVCNIKWDSTARAISYTVEVWADGVLRRTRTVAVTSFGYSAADAKADGGPWRTLTFKVRANGTGTTSAGWASLEATNTQIGAVDNIVVTGFLASLMVEYSRPANSDFAGVRVYVSTTNGFTPDAGNLKYDGPDNVINIDLNPGSATYYLKLSGYDQWGTDSLTMSAQYSAATSLIVSTQITDGSISTPKLAANAVTADKIAANTITASQIAAGTITSDRIAAGTIAADRMNVSSLSAISANIGTATAGKVQNSGGTNYMNMDATGTQSFIKVGSAVDIKADGSGSFARTIVSAPNIVASGTASVSSPWLYETSAEWVRYIDTGIYVGTDWATASTDMYEVAATISGGSSTAGGMNGYTFAEPVIGDGLLTTAPNTPIDNRIYIKFSFKPVDSGYGGGIQITSINWKLARV